MNYRLLFFIALMSLAVFQSAFGQGEQIRWFTFSEKYQAYIPTYDPGNKVGFFVRLSNVNQNLLVDAPEATALFLNEMLLLRMDNDQSLSLDLDSLGVLYQLDSAFVTIYHSEALAGLNTVLQSKDTQVNKQSELLQRFSLVNHDFYIFAIVLILFAAGIIRTNASPQSAYLLEFRQLFLSQIVDNPFYSNSFFSRKSIRYYVILSFIYGVLGVYFVGLLSRSLPGPDRESFSSLSVHWLLYSAIAYAIYYIKFLLYKFLSGIYNYRRFTLIQNYDFMRMSMIISLVYFVSMFIDLFLIELNLLFLLIIPIITIAVFILTAYRKLNKLYSHTKLHLISYLCVSEIVPCIFFIGMLGN